MKAVNLQKFYANLICLEIDYQVLILHLQWACKTCHHDESPAYLEVWAHKEYYDTTDLVNIKYMYPLVYSGADRNH